MVQSCPEASPVKWHQAHTTWFFETFVLRPFLADYKPFREEFHRLFNSYYISLGAEIPERKLRSSFARPSLDEVLAFRAHVDQEMERLFTHSFDGEVSRRIIFGLNHEQQHQELALTDIKHALFSNPLQPSYGSAALQNQRVHPAPNLRWLNFEGGLTEIGYSRKTEDPLDFCFDNETPRHRVYLEPFQMANRNITCREYLEFISDDGYMRHGARRLTIQAWNALKASSGSVVLISGSSRSQTWLRCRGCNQCRDYCPGKGIRRARYQGWCASQ
jgi:ergothioneine biosynthesis protein EgtB